MDKVELKPDDLDMLRVRVARMNAYKQLAQAEEVDIQRLLHKIYGVDLSDNWTFDVEKGILERASSPEQQG